MNPDVKSPPPKWQPAKDPDAWLRRREPVDLDVIEHEGRCAVLENVSRRDPKTGEVQQVPVRVWSPTNHDKVRARIEALEWVRALAKLPNRPTWAEACDLLSESYVDQLDSVCLLARCTRDHDDPRHQHMHYEDLDRYYGRATLLELWERVGLHDAEQDPRITEVDEARFWDLVTAVDRMRSVLPLAVIGGEERDSFTLTMASRLMSLRRRSSSSPSTET